jgi:hypothetical protein
MDRQKQALVEYFDNLVALVMEQKQRVLSQFEESATVSNK